MLPPRLRLLFFFFRVFSTPRRYVVSSVVAAVVAMRTAAVCRHAAPSVCCMNAYVAAVARPSEGSCRRRLQRCRRATVAVMPVAAAVSFRLPVTASLLAYVIEYLPQRVESPDREQVGPWNGGVVGGGLGNLHRMAWVNRAGTAL